MTTFSSLEILQSLETVGEDRKIVSVHPDILYCDFQKGLIAKRVMRKHLQGSLCSPKLLGEFRGVSGCF